MRFLVAAGLVLFGSISTLYGQGRSARDETIAEMLRTQEAMAEALARLDSKIRSLMENQAGNSQIRELVTTQATFEQRLEELQAAIRRLQSRGSPNRSYSFGNTSGMPTQNGVSVSDYDHYRTVSNHYRYAPSSPVRAASPEFVVPLDLHANWNSRPHHYGQYPARKTSNSHMPSILTGSWIADRYYPPAVQPR